MLQIEKLTFSYNDQPLINDLNYLFQENKIYGIKGPSGCGKTTLLKIISAIIKDKYQGNVLINNQKVSLLNQSLLVDNIGYIMQNPENQFVCLDVYDELVFGLENKCLSIEEINDKVANLLKILPIEELLKRPLSQLSFGQKQIIAIASILLMEPYILLCDEIASALDKNHIIIVNNALEAYKKDHIILRVEHNNQLLNSCDEVLDLEVLCSK